MYIYMDLIYVLILWSSCETDIINKWNWTRIATKQITKLIPIPIHIKVIPNTMSKITYLQEF